MHNRAGLRALPEDLIDLDALIGAYYETKPDVSNPAQKVVFGTSGHRGSSLDGGFNEDHILAVTQAVIEQRAAQGITGPIFVGRDTHGLSEPAFRSVLEVLAGNGVTALIDAQDGYTPTPAVFARLWVRMACDTAGVGV
jgi:phosphoglucomutase